MRRSCMTCWAYFEKETDDATLDVLRNHLSQCSVEEPYKNDPNADGYEDF